MSERVSTCAPRTKPFIPVPMLEPSWYHRRVLRSLKKVFQSRWSGMEFVFEVGDVEEGGSGEGELREDAERVVIEVADLNWTLRFGIWTRRRGVVDSWRGSGEDVVWYGGHERSVGCNRQPMAAVRRVGIWTNIVALGREVVGGEFEKCESDVDS